jgi:hypothetical protein
LIASTVIAIIALASPTGSRAQNLNVESVDAAVRIASMSDPDAEQTSQNIRKEGRLDGLEDRIEGVIDRLHRNGIYPQVGSIVSGSGLAAGISLRSRHFGASPIAGEIEGMWSQRGYQRYGAIVGLIDRRRDIFELAPADENISSMFSAGGSQVPGTAAHLSLWYRNSPRVDFFGVAPSQAETRTDFAVSGTTLDAVVQWQSRRVFAVSMRAGLLNLGVGEGSNDRVPNLHQQFAASEAPGLLRPPRYLTAGVAAAADTRDNNDAPASGGFMGVAVWRFVSLDPGAESFTRVAFDWREYVPVHSDRHVAAFRVLASSDLGNGESMTPFYLQNWMGGSRSLRAFPSYRFRGRALAHVTAEYRWRATRHVEIAPFVDAGSVAPGASALFSSPVFVAPGIGLRVRDDDQVLLRLDWARGRDGNRFLVAFGPAF